MRGRWWLVVVCVGVLLGAVGLTLLSGVAQIVAFCLGGGVEPHMTVTKRLRSTRKARRAAAGGLLRKGSGGD
jgi:cytochrome c-type biogenesis protein CcmE